MEEMTLAHANAFFDNQLSDLLKKLEPDTEPRWGHLTAQHMVEHLTWAIDGAMERWKATIVTPEEQLPKFRRFLRSNLAMRHNFEHPQMPPPGQLPPLRTPSIEAAIKEYWERWEEYGAFIQTNPDKLTDHVVFGPLDAEEWRLMHFKHVVHHLSQFGMTTVEEQGLVMPQPR